MNEGWGQIVTPLDIQTMGGKQKLNCASTENAFRLIQSIPSKKAEPFKRWLARVGYERVQNIEMPANVLRQYHKAPITLPQAPERYPAPAALEWHRENVFGG